MLDVRIRSWASQSLNTSHPRANPGLIGHGKEADLPRGPYVGTATEFLAKAGDLDGAHLFTVLFTKECQRPPGNGTIEIHRHHLQGGIGPDLLVDQALDAVQLALAEARKMCKIEP